MSRFSPLLLLLPLGCSEFRAREDAATPAACSLEPCESVGASACDGDLVRVCVDTGGGCIGWSASAGCPVVGERCAGAGVCGLDACPEDGTAQCQGPSGRVTCVAGPSGFLDWSPYEACAAGSVCGEGKCAPVACDAEGVRSCAPDGSSFRVCGSGGDWSAPTACRTGAVCLGRGVCGVHECAKVGASSCDGAAATRKCELSVDGFRHRGATVACPSGELCGPSGECGLHACGPKGAIECDGKDGVKECVGGAAGFLEWAPAVPCPEGQYCGTAGFCGKDGCPSEGAAECMDAVNRRVCTASVGGFLGWAEPTACADNETCVVDTCVPDECPGAGALACTDEKHLHQCVLAETGVLVWSPPEKCEGSAVCKAQGVCGKDQCPEDGLTICDGDGDAMTKTCHLGPSGFLQWDPPVPCPAVEQVCKVGLCGQDLCPTGAASCQEGLVVSCAVGPDGFLGWAAPAPCEGGTVCMGAGQCTPPGELEVWPEAVSGRPDVAPMAGGVAVVFTGSVSGGTSVFLRRLSLTGQPLEDALDVSGVLSVSPPFPTVVTLPESGPHAVAVAWLAGSDGTLRVRRYLSLSEPPLADVAFKPTSPFAAEPMPRSVRMSPGQVGVVNIEGGSKQVVRLAIVDEVGVSAGPFALATVPGPALTGLGAAPRPDGGALVGWTLAGPSAVEATGLVVLPVPASGEVTASPLALPVETANPGRPWVAMAANGEALVAYDVGTGSGSTGIRAWRIDANGSAQGAEIHVNQITPGDQLSPSAAALPGGLWWVVWQGPDAAEQGIWGRVLDAAGKPSGDDEAVNLTTEATQEVPATCALGDGRRVVVWRSGKGGAARVVARFLDAL